MNAEQIVQKLSSFPNRACAGEFKKPVIEYLSSLFPKENIIIEDFKTPKNYLVVVNWLILGMIVGLLLLPRFDAIGLLINICFGTMAVLYFNWYSSPITAFPPLVKSSNIIIKDSKKATKKVILMAHWDTAPISILYAPSMVGNFRTSLKINLLLIVSAVIISVFYWLMPNPILVWISRVFAIYFLVQLVVASWDFYKFGYSNGASDNATGVAAAVLTAQKLLEENLPNIEIELVLTGAEEVGMIGAKAYYDNRKQEWDDHHYLINFDTLGAGSLKVINETGSWGNIVYDNVLTKISKSIIESDSELGHVHIGAWHTADFDSVWFQRAGIHSLTLAALDQNGRMPNIHRETDILGNVDFEPMHDAIDLACKIVRKLN